MVSYFCNVSPFILRQHCHIECSQSIVESLLVCIQLLIIKLFVAVDRLVLQLVHLVSDHLILEC